MKIEAKNEYKEREDGDELFAVRGGQGRDAGDVVESAMSLWIVVAVAAACVAMVWWRATR